MMSYIAQGIQNLTNSPSVKYQNCCCYTAGYLNVVRTSMYSLIVSFTINVHNIAKVLIHAYSFYLIHTIMLY